MKEITPAPIKPTISFSDLDKLDIRIGTIISVDEVDNSEKLVKLKVDFGDHQRQILVGMKQEREDPKEVEGKQALFVVNLEPKKMAGELSEGMILDIGYTDKIIPVLAMPEKQVPNGVRAG
jgi:tRNA-binding protein